MTTFTEEITPYFDGGRMSLKLPREENDNAFLFASTALFVAERLGETDAFRPFAENIRYLIWKRTITPGLYSPLPSWDVDASGLGSLSHDEILGIGRIGKAYAADIVSYGRRHLWVFNNRNRWSDTFRQWQGRFPTMIAFLYSRAGKLPLHPFNHLYAIGEFLLADRKSAHGDTSGKCLTFLMADHFYRNGSAPMKWAAKKYLQFLQDEYGTVGRLYAIYFGPEHPLSKHTMELKFI
jgi:hypothetical protein